MTLPTPSAGKRQIMKSTQREKKIKTITMPISKQAAWTAFWTGKIEIVIEEKV